MQAPDYIFQFLDSAHDFLSSVFSFAISSRITNGRPSAASEKWRIRLTSSFARFMYPSADIIHIFPQLPQVAGSLSQLSTLLTVRCLHLTHSNSIAVISDGSIVVLVSTVMRTPPPKLQRSGIRFPLPLPLEGYSAECCDASQNCNRQNASPQPPQSFPASY